MTEEELKQAAHWWIVDGMGIWTIAQHFGVVLFVIAGLPLVVVGHVRGWGFVNAFPFRLAHLGAIAVVAAQA